MRTIVRVFAIAVIGFLPFGCGEDGGNGPPGDEGNGWKPVPKWRPPDATEQKSFYERSLKDATARHQGYGYTFAAAFSDDGKRLVLGGGRGIQILEVSSMKVLHAVKGAEFGEKTPVDGISCLHSADFLDDVRFVGGTDSGGLVIVDMQKKITEKKIGIFYRGDNNVYVKVFPDRKRVLASGDVAVAKDDTLPRIVYEGPRGPKSHSVCVVNLESGAVEKEYINAELVGLSRSSGRFAITRAEKNGLPAEAPAKAGASIKHFLEIYKCDGLSLIKSFPVEQHGTPRGRFSPNGRWLLMRIGEFKADIDKGEYFLLLDMETNTVVRKFDGRMLDADSLGYVAGIANDGRYAVFGLDFGFVVDLNATKILKGWYLGTNDSVTSPDAGTLMLFDHAGGLCFFFDVASVMKETK